METLNNNYTIFTQFCNNEDTISKETYISVWNAARCLANLHDAITCLPA